jgi:hypothetical protein
MIRCIIKKWAFTILAVSSLLPIRAQETQYQYLSGTGSDHTINWQFFCTAGRNSGKWASIPVPSNWELQGFGKYDYGHVKDTVRGWEKGLYKYAFKAPSSWKGYHINIVFEGSMTDTEVKINGKSAGAIHQGAFYRFKYDISKLLNYEGKNLLEVTVSKQSSNKDVNRAERKADYWIFGGIFRPVYLEALPLQHIAQIALDAKANGAFNANVSLKNIQSATEVSAQVFTLDGQKAGIPFSSKIKKGDTLINVSAVIKSIKTWTPESPNLYRVEVALNENGKTIHSISQRFGFRTIELRERDGIYLNGVKIKFKGVNRHCFWPSTGRATCKQISLDDAKLIKEMNMNAVRMSHYPPDEHFLEVCDSLGLMVLDELAGWHAYYDTPTGTKLTRAMIAKDGNHPSVVIWGNGDEGGHNLDLVPVMDEDIQKRPVVLPWEVFRGTDTQHYKDYDYGNGELWHGHNVTFPTEFLHGLYDGGLGASLFDYWEMMWRNPLSAGGFLWVFCDEGVVRTDQNGFIDNDGSHAPDGILGPYREKEASFYTIKQVWSPIYFEHREISPKFDGTFRIENRYHFTNLNQCKFSWKLGTFETPDEKSVSKSISGEIESPDIEPGMTDTLLMKMPSNWDTFDVLYITATGPDGNEIFTWSWPISRPAQIVQKLIPTNISGTVETSKKDSMLIVAANGIKLYFNQKTGLLKQAENSKGIIPFGNGPIICEGEMDFVSLKIIKDGENVVISDSFGNKSNLKEVKWTITPTGWVKLDVKYWPTGEESNILGITFDYPESNIKGVRYLGDGPYRVWKNRTQGNKLGVWNKDYNNTVTGESQKLIYPEFKGYHSNLYWAKFLTTSGSFTVATETEDIFLHLFTPQPPKETFNVSPEFPKGNISFLHGITPIGTKSQKAINMGPSGKKNMFFDYWKARWKSMTLWFDFSAE